MKNCNKASDVTDDSSSNADTAVNGPHGRILPAPGTYQIAGFKGLRLFTLKGLFKSQVK